MIGNLIELINNILVFIFVFVSSFLIHELMHIKSQGLLMGGTIRVTKYGMYVTADKVNNKELFFYGGGILTSIIMFILVFLSNNWWRWSFLTMGILQLFYGMYEGYTKGKVKYRGFIYIFVIIFMFIIYYM
jgi:hypothetical protein